MTHSAVHSVQTCDALRWTNPRRSPSGGQRHLLLPGFMIIANSLRWTNPRRTRSIGMPRPSESQNDRRRVLLLLCSQKLRTLGIQRSEIGRVRNSLKAARDRPRSMLDDVRSLGMARPTTKRRSCFFGERSPTTSLPASGHR